jgi:hypothetical protein
VQSEAETEGVQRAPEFDFGPGVHLAAPAEVATGGGRHPALLSADGHWVHAASLSDHGQFRCRITVVPEPVAGRAYARVYATSGRTDLYTYLLAAVIRSGGRVLYSSSAVRAPVYLGLQTSADYRVGVLVYPFRATHRLIRNRPVDEHRLQLRYGAEPSWGGEHRLGRDTASIDTTVVVGVHLAADLRGNVKLSAGHGTFLPWRRPLREPRYRCSREPAG